MQLFPRCTAIYWTQEVVPICSGHCHLSLRIHKHVAEQTKSDIADGHARPIADKRFSRMCHVPVGDHSDKNWHRFRARHDYLIRHQGWKILESIPGVIAYLLPVNHHAQFREIELWKPLMRRFSHR